MSRLIVACARDTSIDGRLGPTLERCALRIVPDNITPRPPTTHVSPGLAFTVVNPAPGLSLGADGICLGAMLAPAASWPRMSAPAPDGTYVLLRQDGGQLELVSDALGSRTLWYVMTPDLFLASTSQRAIVSLLGDFQADADAVRWMITSGTLGPTASWDRRLQRLPCASTLRLDRRSWTLHVTSEPVESEPSGRPDEDLTAELGAAILDSCEDLRVDLDDWLLPLSGGMDSRALLAAFLATGRRPRCVTWGLRSALADPANDAAVAKAVADATGVDHRYYAIDHSTDDVDRVLDRFLVASEGRTEDFAGYTDGLATWKQLFEAGVAGIIRGDEPGWGYRAYHSESYARRRVHLTVLTDYPRGHLVNRLGLDPQPVPPEFQRRPSETLTGYRARIYDAFTLPTFFAALNDVKAPYVEIANPFLTRRVVRVVRTLPDHLLDHRRAFAMFVRAYGPDLPFATQAAPAEPTDYLAGAGVTAEVRRELGSADAERVLSRAALDRVVDAIGHAPALDARRRLRSAARRAVPDEIARRLYPNAPIMLDARELAFRIYIASRMARMLQDDAAASDAVWRADTLTATST